MVARRTAGKGRGVVQLGSGVRVGAEKRPLLRLSAKNSPGTTCVPSALLALSEAAFQRIVRAALENLGFVVWVVPNMKLTTAGLPDIVAWHPNRPGLLLAWELKRETGKPTTKQRAAIDHLSTVPGIDARIIRPSDWEAARDDLIRQALGSGAQGEE